MKHLKKFNESLEEKRKVREDIIDNFIHISDLLGEPNITSEKWGVLYKWIITWETGIDLTIMNDVEIVITKLKTILDELDDVLSAEDRLTDYIFKMVFTKHLTIELTPKDLGPDDGKNNFIKREDGRLIEVNIVNIERYFKKKGFNLIKKWETNDEAAEMAGNCSVYIKFDKTVSTIVMDEFQELINNGLLSGGRNQPGDIYVYKNGSTLVISPDIEKTYITL